MKEPISATAAIVRKTAAKAAGGAAEVVAVWGSAVAEPPPRATKRTPATPTMVMLPSASETWREAELEPSSPGRESFRSSTLPLEIVTPIPYPPMNQDTATIHAGTPEISAVETSTMAAAISSSPMLIIRSRYGSRRGRLWVYEPSAQLRPPPVSESPASVADMPRSVTSISGTKLSAPRNEPAATPRSSTTDGRPRAARNVPFGSSRRMPGTSRASPAAAGIRESHFRSRPAYCRSPAPAATASARRMRRRSMAAVRSPGGSLRSAGSMTASGSRISTGMERNTQRQLSCSVTVPATSGPTITGRTQAAEKEARIDGRSRSG